MEKCLIPARISISALMFTHISFSPFKTLIWRVNNYVSQQGKCKNRKNESTKLVILCSDVTNQSPLCSRTTTISSSLQVDHSNKLIKFSSLLVIFVVQNCNCKKWARNSSPQQGESRRRSQEHPGTGHNCFQNTTRIYIAGLRRNWG